MRDEIDSNINNINNNSNQNNDINEKDYYNSMDLSHYANLIFTLSQKYIAILINLSKLLRFHRYSHCAIDKS